MAKQHIYTRGNAGLFTHVEGYDTIAVSNGLTEDYVKHNIYPFCFYEKNNFDDEEADITPDVYYYKYIKSPEDNGTAVIFGKNSYIYSHRNYMLCNSIIVYGNELKKLYDNFENFIEFDGYSIKPDNPCIIDDIIVEDYFKSYNVFMERDFIFRLLSINEKKFKCFLNNLFQCIERKETIYVKLGCERKFCSRYAKKLIKIIFINIPTSLKKRLSYITYSPTINIKIFFNIVFLDSKVNMKSAKDMGICFDFSENVEFNSKSYFLDFSWKNVIFANRMFLQSEAYKYEYSNNNILSQLDKAVIENILTCKNKFDFINKNMSISVKEYIDLLNLFFDLKFFYKDESKKWISKIKVIEKDLKFVNYKYILDNVDFLIMKKPNNNQTIFSNIIYMYYQLDFNDYVELITNKIKKLTDFEDFIIISFFYINYIDGLIKKEAIDIINDAINKKLNCFEEKSDNTRKEYIDGLSIYLWKRYSKWL